MRWFSFQGFKFDLGLVDLAQTAHVAQMALCEMPRGGKLIFLTRCYAGSNFALELFELATRESSKATFLNRQEKHVRCPPLASPSLR